MGPPLCFLWQLLGGGTNGLVDVLDFVPSRCACTECESRFRVGEGAGSGLVSSRGSKATTELCANNNSPIDRCQR